jgi:hypothetical protein
MKNEKLDKEVSLEVFPLPEVRGGKKSPDHILTILKLFLK